MKENTQTSNFKIAMDEGVSIESNRKPIVFVSSSVYDKRDLLVEVRDLLKGFGFTPWLSMDGTFPVEWNDSAFGNCIKSVEKADFFIGIISPWYGSGVDKATGESVTHQEMRRAVELDKPRLMMVDERVCEIKNFLDELGFKGLKGREEFRELLDSWNPKNGAKRLGEGQARFLLAKRVCDLRAIDLYEEMTFGRPRTPEGKPLEPSRRTGNWIQACRTIEDFRDFVAVQFSNLMITPITYRGLRQAAQRIKESFNPREVQS